MDDQEELIFVYNADSGKWNGYMDILHKVFSPSTYPCHLCAITYGTFSMKEEWANFIGQLPYPVRFLHRDEWIKEFERDEELPAIFLKKGDELIPWIDAQLMTGMDLTDLKGHIYKKIKGV